MVNPPYGSRGFSAWELWLALGILAVLVSLVVPRFAEAQRAWSLNAAASEALGALHYARSAAALRSLPTVVCLSDDGQRCIERAGQPARGWIIFHDLQPGLPVQVDGGDERLRSFELPPQLSVSGSRAAVTFWPTTRAGTPATLLLCHEHLGRQGRAVVVSRTGRPRVTGLTESKGGLSCV